MWESGILGTGNPEQIQSVLLFFIGTSFGFRACQEQHESLDDKREESRYPRFAHPRKELRGPGP